MPHVPYKIDGLGVARTEDGSVIDLHAGAYDTCVALGQDPAYADSTMLPEKVRAYYAPHGDDVVRYAALGWMRGRGFSMKDPWQKFVAPDRGRKAARKVRASTITATSQNQPVPEWHPLDLLTSSRRSKSTGTGTSTSTSTKAEPVRAGHAVAVDVEKVLLTPDVVKALSADLKKQLREHLQHQEWMPQDKGDRTWECRFVSDVLRTLRLRSTNGLSGPWSLIASDLKRELAWHRPTLSGSRTFRAEDL